MSETYNMPEKGLFGMRCRIQHVFNMEDGFVYRIVDSGMESNAWQELPLGGCNCESVIHNHSEPVLIVVCDTLINERSKLERVALKDVKIMWEEKKSGKAIEAWNGRPIGKMDGYQLGFRQGTTPS